MGNNVSCSTQWSEEPDTPQYQICGCTTPDWPFKRCTRRVGHEGNHCERKLAGTVMIEYWWPQDKEPQQGV